MRPVTLRLARPKLLASLLLTASLACAGMGAPARPPQATAASGHGYALLYAILAQEKQVSQLLIIKQDREALGTVIDAIAQACGTAYDRLGVLAELNPRLDLAHTGLPADEVRTRQLIGATRRELLLASSGIELELQLLLTQNEALTYAAHLADTLSRGESDPARLAFDRALWKELTGLLFDVQALLRRPLRAGG
jgi:hypothetical protein